MVGVLNAIPIRTVTVTNIATRVPASVIHACKILIVKRSGIAMATTVTTNGAIPHMAVAFVGEVAMQRRHVAMTATATLPRDCLVKLSVCPRT